MGTLPPLRRKSKPKNKGHLRIVRSHAWSEPALAADDDAVCTPQRPAPKSALNSAKRIVLSLGHAMPQGIPVTLQIGSEGELPSVSMTGWLPPAKALVAAYEQWQQTYQQFFSGGVGLVSRLSTPAVQITNVSYQETMQNCCYAEKVLSRGVNQWLNSELFRPAKEMLLAYCHPKDAIRLILQTDDFQIQRLPLHLWDWFKLYRQAELVLGSATYVQSASSDGAADSLRILAVLGDSPDLDTDYDLALLEALPTAAVTCLRSPTRSQLNEALWDHPWDIILLAGHSDGEHQPKFRLNAYESFSLSNLKYGFERAIAQNLQLLILNTCDSLSLINALKNDLYLPATIAMRAPVPDPVAQMFLRYFLIAFAQGQSLPRAVREAREQLQGIEHQCPFASWIPVLYQTL